MATSTTPISSHRVSLMHYAGSSYTQLCCIKDFPDLSTKVEPDQIETTTLCDEYHEFIDGLKNYGDDLEFTANYVKADYDTINALSGTQQFAIYFNSGDSFDGDNGKFYFGGEVSARVSGTGVGEVIEMVISVKIKEALSTTEPTTH
jgi:hypothetical protein